MLKELLQNDDTEPFTDIIESPESGHDEATDASCGLLSVLYARSVGHLSATSKQLPRPERMPPTENAVISLFCSK